MRTKALSLLLAAAMLSTSALPVYTLAADETPDLPSGALECRSYALDAQTQQFGELAGTFQDTQLAFEDLSLLAQRAGLENGAGLEWSGWLTPPATGEYTLFVNTEAPVRLYLGDEEIPLLDGWDAPVTEGAAAALEAGESYPLRLECAYTGGEVPLTLEWQAEGIERQVVPASAFALPAQDAQPTAEPTAEPTAQPTEKPARAPAQPVNDQMVHGLQTDFYTVNENAPFAFGEALGTFVDSSIAFGDMEGVLSQRTGRTDWTGAVWSGRIVPPATGTYTFYLYSDNGVRLYVDDMETPVIDWWVNEWDKEQTSRTVQLEAGKAYDLRLEWFEATGGSHVTLKWSNDQGLEKAIVPSSALYLPADFAGPIVNEIDVSGAQLDKDQGELGGVIVLRGQNLAEGTAVLANLGGKPVTPETALEVQSSSDTELVLKVPADLKVGMYRLLVTAGGVTVATDGSFSVTSSSEVAMDRPEHPRPDWQRTQWMNLNGWWDFDFDPDAVGKDQNWQEGRDYSMKINVPFPWESPMSGIENTSYLGDAWYQRTFQLDESWDGRQIFLKFGAVDWKSTLYVNGQKVGDHEGGYTPFEFDITDYVQQGDNVITLWVEDEASYGKDEYPALVGKQGLNAPCGYTHTSGIWQTVYLEGRSSTYLDYAHANPDIDNAQVTFDLQLQSDTAQTVTVEYDFSSVLWDTEKDANVSTGSSFRGSQTIQLQQGQTNLSLDAIDIPDQKLWNFDSPNLYEGTLRLVSEDGTVLDEVSTYFGQRKVDTRNYDGREYRYIYVNNEPVFLSGLLDQGFWAEGVYTAPSADALRYDIEAMRDRGFNMIRKHLKIEDPIQYLWCDRLGMFVWQDMPHATYMNAHSEGDQAPGRAVYEYALEQMLSRDYNHPSVIAVMLFNETWGINHNAPTASDGMSTDAWIAHMYDKAKSWNPNLLVEDMSACNQDHIQPTDLNTFHMYPKGYQSSKNVVADFERNTYPGSNQNFRPGHTQDGDPWLNSEYGGVAAYDKDWDVSWCFKYQTDIQRQYEKLNGFVYTEPFDVEYERNGILTYDRRDKIFGYDEIAYGGDMSINDLTQPNYVGIDIDPAAQMQPGSEYSAPAVALNWSGNTYDNAVMKWRFDATDVYGNQFTTGIGGEFELEYKPYTREEHTIRFDLPTQKCVGTITVWIEDGEGNKIAKNFVNVIGTSRTSSKDVEYVGEDTVVLRRDGDKPDSDTFENGAGSVTYTYTLPESFDVSQLRGMRLLAEASSRKDETVNFGISNSSASQTTVGSERASDMTVLVNGHEVDTVLLPDNPRDIRGTLTLPQGLNGGSSAGNFGYLVSLNVPDELLEQLRAEIAESGTLTVTYAVKEDAANRNGLRLYTEDNGRYMVDPTVLLNPADVRAEGSVDTESSNYAVEAALHNGQSYTLRDGAYTVSMNGGEVRLTMGDTLLGSAPAADGALVRTRLFDDHIQLFVNNDPVPVIDVYEFSGFTGGVAASEGVELLVAPETYPVNQGAEAQPDVQLSDTFNTNKGSQTQQKPENTTFATRYELIAGDKSFPNDPVKSDGLWDGSNENDNLYVEADWGNKAVVAGTKSSDVVVEVDITLQDTQGEANGNMGVILRGSDFTASCDGANGYYVGLGVQGKDDGNVKGGQGFIEVGRMEQGWTSLAKVPADSVKAGQTNRLKVVMVGQRLRVYLNDEPMPYVDVYDSTYASGSVALRAFRVSGTYDNLVVSTAPRYEADFENARADEWTDSGLWAVQDGQLVAKGAGSALVGNYGWTDYELSADVTLQNAQSSAGLAVRGVMNKDKYSGYRVVLDASGSIRLVRSTAGADEVLRESYLDVQPGQTYSVTVRTVNNAMRVYVDGALVMTVADNAWTNGMAGLVTESGTASFDNVKVTDKFVYQDEFFDGALSGWNVISGEAEVKDGILNLKRVNNGDKLVDGYATWSDYVIRAKVKLDINPASKSNAGYVFRATDFTVGQDNLRGYVLGINYHENNDKPLESTGIEFGDIHYGWRPIQNTNEFVIDPSQWYDFEVRAIGDQISVLVDGKEYYTVTDTAYTYGMFGIRNFNSGIQVQDLQVLPVTDGEIPAAEIDKSTLNALIAAAKALDENGYTASSWSKLEAALEKACAVSADKNADQQQIDQAAQALREALEQLQAAADKAGLKALLDACAALNGEDYTAESWANLQTAMQTAQSVYDNADATQAEVESAVQLLQKAREQLEANPVPTPVPTPDPDPEQPTPAPTAPAQPDGGASGLPATGESFPAAVTVLLLVLACGTAVVLKREKHFF